VRWFADKPPVRLLPLRLLVEKPARLLVEKPLRLLV
jgi:hypothetical protein